MAGNEDDATVRLTEENRALRAELDRAKKTLAAFDEEFALERHARAATQRERDELRDSLASVCDDRDKSDEPDESEPVSAHAAPPFRLAASINLPGVASR